MKGKLIIIIVSAAFIVSALFNFSLSSKLSASREEGDQLREEIGKMTTVKDLLEEGYQLVSEQLKETEESLRTSNNELEAMTTTFETIDEKLESNGDIMAGVDALIADNEKWRQELNDVTTRLLEIEAQLEETSNQEPDPDQEALLAKQKATSLKDLGNVITYIEERIAELQEASDTLPAISLERLMINQEIDFLNEAVKAVDDIRDDMTAQ